MYNRKGEYSARLVEIQPAKEGEEVLVVTPRNWEVFVNRYGETATSIDFSKTSSFNPLEVEGNGEQKLTISDMLGPWGNIKTFEEVLRSKAVPFELWERAASILENIRKEASM